MIVLNIIIFTKTVQSNHFVYKNPFFELKRNGKISNKKILINMISYPDPKQGKQVDGQDYGVECCGDWYVLCAPLKIIVN